MTELFFPALFTILLSLLSLFVAMVGGLYLGIDYQRREEGFYYDEDEDEDFLYNFGMCCGVASIIILALTISYVVPR